MPAAAVIGAGGVASMPEKRALASSTEESPADARRAPEMLMEMEQLTSSKSAGAVLALRHRGVLLAGRAAASSSTRASRTTTPVAGSYVARAVAP